MEHRYVIVKAQLEELGYCQNFSTDSLPLIEKLLGDLIQTTESLQKYLRISQEIVTERDGLLLGAEPYRCDNARLVRECNELHSTFLRYREKSESLKKDLERRIRDLERERDDWDKENRELREKVKGFQIGGATQKAARKPLKSATSSSLAKGKGESSASMTLAESKIANLTKEVGRLKEDKLELAQANSQYKNQIESRDKEIQRLTQMLTGGRPAEALNQDCCYKNIEHKIVKLQDEVTNLKKNNSDLESRLKETVAKQHEAMKRALSLAERNRVLETELKDIDRMALAVEHECNSTVQNNTEKVNRLQNRLHEAVLQMQQLEKEMIELKRDKHELLEKFESCKSEKKQLEAMLENTLEEKKRATSRVTQYGIIENDLNLEIDRLVQLNAEQKRKIAELESKLSNGFKNDEKNPKRNLSADKNKGFKGRQPSKTKADTGFPRRSFETVATSPIQMKSPCEPDRCIKKIEEIIAKEIRAKNICFDHLKDVVGKELNDLHEKAVTSSEHFKEERDFYKKECDGLMEKIKVICSKPEDPGLEEKLKESEAELNRLRHECRCLNQEKHNLLIRMGSVRSQAEDVEALSHRSSTKRLERERDLLKADIQHLEEERDSLRHRINILCENYNQEKCRLENMLRDRERDVRQLEQDRREFMQNQGTRRATINGLQDECDLLQTQLKSCQGELTQQRAMYSQLKMLHEHTDRALADCQSQLMQAEKEMFGLQARVKSTDEEKENCRKEIINLKNDLAVAKNNLMSFDREKDNLVQNLDEKTESLVSMETDMRAKEKKIQTLETELAELKKRISDNLTERSSKEYLLKSATEDIQKLQQDVDSANRSKQLALEENRRLQDDLSSCAADNKKLNSELEIARRQVDDLKRQLQQYVAEIKRAEDLISQKELQRMEMLDHYRSLSEEATNLETTNHSLENQASEAKVQLSVALDHAADLEKKTEEQATMIRDCEKQIYNLTGQIAKLETKVNQLEAQKDGVETEVASMRDLCLKLDKQKDNLLKQLNERDTASSQITKENSTLRRNSQTLQTELDRERATVESLQRHLAQCRQESMEMRVLNDGLREDVQKLKTTIQDLQTKLTSVTEQLDVYQGKALDYSNQNKQLRREVVNERFYSQLCLCVSMQTEKILGKNVPAQTSRQTSPENSRLKVSQQKSPSKSPQKLSQQTRSGIPQEFRPRTPPKSDRKNLSSGRPKSPPKKDQKAPPKNDQKTPPETRPKTPPYRPRTPPKTVSKSPSKTYRKPVPKAAPEISPKVSIQSQLIEFETIEIAPDGEIETEREEDKSQMSSSISESNLCDACNEEMMQAEEMSDTNAISSENAPQKDNFSQKVLDAYKEQIETGDDVGEKEMKKDQRLAKKVHYRKRQENENLKEVDVRPSTSAYPDATKTNKVIPKETRKPRVPKEKEKTPARDNRDTGVPYYPMLKEDRNRSTVCPPVECPRRPCPQSARPQCPRSGRWY